MSTICSNKHMIVHGENVQAVCTKFMNGRTCILLLTEDGCPYIRCVANVPEVDLEDDEVVIRTYGECEGILPILQEAGIVGPALKYVVGGHVRMPVCKLLIEVEDTDA